MISFVSFVNSKGVIYFLNSKIIKLRGNRDQRIYYFSREAGENSLSEIPAGFEIVEGKSGLVFLRRVKN